jgi:hypothetical protein
MSLLRPYETSTFLQNLERAERYDARYTLRKPYRVSLS